MVDTAIRKSTQNGRETNDFGNAFFIVLSLFCAPFALLRDFLGTLEEIA